MPKKILLIEDDQLLRGLISQKISKEGYTILQAVDGESGLKAVSDQRPDLVLLDILLPGIDGFEVLKKIKADASTTRIPVIILSNLWGKEYIEKGMKLGAVDYLIKINFGSAEVLDRIKTILK